MSLDIALRYCFVNATLAEGDDKEALVLLLGVFNRAATEGNSNANALMAGYRMTSAIQRCKNPSAVAEIVDHHLTEISSLYKQAQR